MLADRDREADLHRPADLHDAVGMEAAVGADRQLTRGPGWDELSGRGRSSRAESGRRSGRSWRCRPAAWPSGRRPSRPPRRGAGDSPARRCWAVSSARRPPGSTECASAGAHRHADRRPTCASSGPRPVITRPRRRRASWTRLGRRPSTPSATPTVRLRSPNAGCEPNYYRPKVFGRTIPSLSTQQKSSQKIGGETKDHDTDNRVGHEGPLAGHRTGDHSEPDKNLAAVHCVARYIVLTKSD